MLTSCKHCSGRGTEPLPPNAQDLHALQNQPCRTHDGNTCNACRAMISLEAKILDAQAALLQLLNLHRDLREEMNQAHSLINQRLAPELLSSIFQCCIDDNIEDGMSSSGVKIDIRAPYTLAAVCKAWRSIALSTPNLWNKVFITIDQNNDVPLQAQLLREWLSRSGDLPLKICTKYNRNALYPGPHDENDAFAETPILDIINQYSSRWQDLYFTVSAAFLKRLRAPNGTPLLRTVSLYPQQWFRDCKWQLNHATPQNLYLNLSKISHELENTTDNMFNVDWSAVTRLVSTDFPRVLQHGIRQASNLQYLEIIIPSQTTPAGDEVLQGISITNSNVKEFTYQCRGEPKLMSFDLPAAQMWHMKLNMLTTQAGIDSFKASLERSPCLTHLTIYIMALKDKLIHILHSVPSLQSLTIEGTFLSFGQEDGLFAHLCKTATTNPAHFLPNLRMISCHARARNTSWTNLPLVFGPLGELTNPARRPLTSFVVLVFGSYQDPEGPIPASCIDPTLIPQLKSLKDAKLNLEVRHRRSNRNLLPWPLNEQ
ncbi:hypothetical protein JR316_0013155 [Psilocybe cubensis]|uniref:Uncharacterized protein n=2 Tax=Psilocybe cubensis TaxID=181762 RepID=A0ACB8GGY4_PSICU|nr:hypothetical protein JR316_0013155 [Psilocybe cubensis]KAH9474690.1 hypothetical protein JR316_0013155 [Psilocybe cubensis]